MRRVPMLWAALAALATAAVIGLVYLLAHLGVGGPGGASRFELKVEFADAAGLDARDRPLAAVAGTRQGRVTGVRREGGRAVATLSLEADVEGKIFTDAAATIRPVGAVPILWVDVDPGTPGSKPIAAGATIPESRSSTYVAPDKVLDVLDADTRTHLQVLLGESATALRGRSDDLSRATVAAAPLVDTAADVSASLAERRVVIRRLVADLATVARTLRERRETLASAITTGRRVLATTSARSEEIVLVMAELPAMLEDTDRALGEVRAIAGPLENGLRSLSPALADLPKGLRDLRNLSPQTKAMLGEIAKLEKLSATQLPAIREFTKRLPQSSIAGLPAVTAAAGTVKTLSDYAPGVAQLGDTLSGMMSASDVNGPAARTLFTSFEPIKPENFGFPASNTKSLNGSARRLPVMLAAALEHRCETDLNACVLRVTVPGLPPVEARP